MSQPRAMYSSRSAIIGHRPVISQRMFGALTFRTKSPFRLTAAQLFLGISKDEFQDRLGVVLSICNIGVKRSPSNRAASIAALGELERLYPYRRDTGIAPFCFHRSVLLLKIAVKPITNSNPVLGSGTPPTTTEPDPSPVVMSLKLESSMITFDKSILLEPSLSALKTIWISVPLTLKPGPGPASESPINVTLPAPLSISPELKDTPLPPKRSPSVTLKTDSTVGLKEKSNSKA